MKVSKETFFERLRNRLAPAHAVKVIADLQKASRREAIEFMAVKEASEMVDRYRLEAQCAIRVYRLWEARQAVTAALVPLKDHEGRLLRQHARASANLYIDALRDYRDLCRLAMGQCAEAANDRGAK